jgi:hypothetical protein
MTLLSELPIPIPLAVATKIPEPERTAASRLTKIVLITLEPVPATRTKTVGDPSCENAEATGLGQAVGDSREYGATLPASALKDPCMVSGPTALKSISHEIGAAEAADADADGLELDSGGFANVPGVCATHPLSSATATSPKSSLGTLMMRT